MSVTKIPAKPAEYRTVKVSEAAPPKIVVEMSLHAALSFAALAGAFSAVGDDAGLHDALHDHPLYNAYREVRQEWVKGGGENGLNFPDITLGYDVNGAELPAATCDDSEPPAAGTPFRRLTEKTGYTAGRVYFVTVDDNGCQYLLDDDGDRRPFFSTDYEPV